MPVLQLPLARLQQRRLCMPAPPARKPAGWRPAPEPRATEGHRHTLYPASALAHGVGSEKAGGRHLGRLPRFQHRRRSPAVCKSTPEARSLSGSSAAERTTTAWRVAGDVCAQAHAPHRSGKDSAVCRWSQYVTGHLRLVRGRECVRARSGGSGNAQASTATVKCLHGAAYLLRTVTMLVPGVLCCFRGPVLECKNQLLSKAVRGAGMHRNALSTPS